MDINIRNFTGKGNTLGVAMNDALLKMKAHLENNSLEYVSHSHSHSHVVENRECEDVSHFDVSILLVCKSR